jgi:hypothetical protein
MLSVMIKKRPRKKPWKAQPVLTVLSSIASKLNENIMNSNTDYERYDGLGLAGLGKDGSVSAAELLEAAIERVEQRNRVVKAVDLMYDQAKAAISA